MPVQIHYFTNTGDQILGFKVYIAKYFGGQQEEVSKIQAQGDAIYKISVKENVTDVIIKRKSILTLCEVEVFAGKLHFLSASKFRSSFIILEMTFFLDPNAAPHLLLVKKLYLLNVS